MIRRSLIALVFAIPLLTLGALPALAHAEFVSSDPSDGAVADDPVTRVEIVFSGEAEPSGEGFVIRDSTGAVRAPDVVSSEDRMTWVLEFDEALSAGATAVRWTVTAPDAHPIEGSFSFTAPSAQATASAPDASTAKTEAAGTAGLDDFLDQSGEEAMLVDEFGVVARSLTLVGALLSIGGIAFAALVMRGSDKDIRSVVYWVRRASVLLALGAAMELIHQLAVAKGDWMVLWPLSNIGSVVASSFGIAIILRFAGAAMMLKAHLDVVPAQRARDPVVEMQAAVGVGAGPAPRTSDVDTDQGAPTSSPYHHQGDKAWRVGGELGVVAAGIVAAIISFVFDGHTVTEGVRLVTALADVAHVAAGAVWAGGLVMLVHVIWLRHRRGSDTRALQLAVRFSVVAAAALIVAGVAGLALSVIVLDQVSDLWSTPWGRTLMAKLAVVAVAAAAGGYNHKVLIPHMMSRSPNDPNSDAEFRRAVTLEAMAIVLIVILTAILVGASST